MWFEIKTLSNDTNTHTHTHTQRDVCPDSDNFSAKQQVRRMKWVEETNKTGKNLNN